MVNIMFIKKYHYLIGILFCLILSLSFKPIKIGIEDVKGDCSILILGIAQDAGYPQINCQKDCCKTLLAKQEKGNYVSSLAIIDRQSNEYWIIDASPDFKYQLEHVRHELGSNFKMPDGILLTHAHIGHYTGLMDLGKEAINAKSIPIYAMPRMKKFLESNGPWSQLVSLENIELKALKNDQSVSLNDRISITPLLVPHRDEYSETVGFIINGPEKKILFIPDIDKWEMWEKDINQMIMMVDEAFIDATFYNGVELGNRDMSEIPHPFVVETMERFKNESLSVKSKINFIHLNHTNPLLDRNSEASQSILSKGYKIAYIDQKVSI
jgi:pyrroloquinoline quinone biosynthesis protein B